MSSYVLVHGSWHGAWCWKKVTPLLEQAGHRVVALDLPGHGQDRTPFSEITLGAYAQRICDVVTKAPDPVILVGHSMGGGAITQASHWRPDGLAALVYVAAYMPPHGTSIAAQALADAESLIHDHIIIDPLNSTAAIEDEALAECFYGDCSADDTAFARARLRLDPLEPLTTPLDLPPDGGPGVPRAYIECRKDRILTPELQRTIQGLHRFAKIGSLDTSHSPFFSAPLELADQLLECAKLVG
jgi:pimeloyl-ACP methyl ester carboxylesterase